MTLRGWCRMKEVHLYEITENLDYKRKPLNNIERNKMKNNPKYPYYGANGQVDIIDEYIFDEEIICIAEDGGYWGKESKCSYIVNEKCWVNNHAHVLRVNKEVNIKYLFHYLNYADLSSSITGTTRGKLTKFALNNIKIILPSLEMQKKVVEVLDKAQALIDARKEQIRLMDELIKSKFIEMFGDPVTNPKGWEVKKLKDLSSKIMSGNTPKGGNQVYVEKGITFFRSQNVWRNRLELNDVVYIDEKTHENMKQSSLKNKDILITKTGRINTENSSLGRAAMFLGNDDSANINGHVYLVRIRENYFNEFILFILTTEEYREYIRRVCVGGIDKRQINKEHLEEFPIINPPIKEQEMFIEYLKSITNIKEDIKKSLLLMDSNFKALIQRFF